MQICRRLAVLVLGGAGQMGAAGRVDDGIGAMAEAAQSLGISVYPPRGTASFRPMMENAAPGDEAQPGTWDQWQ